MALADTVTERLLGVDGLREAVLYAVGVAPRPTGAGVGAVAAHPAAAAAAAIASPAWARAGSPIDDVC